MTIKLKRDRICAIILDMDGVLIDSEPIQLHAFRLYFENHDIPYTEKLLKSFIGFSVEENLRQIQKSLPTGKNFSIRESIVERNRLYLELLNNEELKTMPGIDEIINCCIQNEILLGLATSSPAEQVEVVLSRIRGAFSTKYKRLFQAIVNGEEVSHKKPAPDIYNLICKKLNTDESQAVSFEDSPAGVQSARHAGLITVGITNTYYNRQDLAAADFIVDSPSEILLML